MATLDGRQRIPCLGEQQKGVDLEMPLPSTANVTPSLPRAAAA